MTGLTEERRKRLEECIEPFRVKPGSRVRLARDFDPEFKAGVKKKRDGVELLAEEVLVVRVHPESLDRQKLPAVAKRRGVWKQRYAEINEWERYLAGNGFRIVKLFLNLSREEQRRRLLRRIDLPDHRWQFSPADVTERGFWDEYQKAYSDVLSHTSTEWAPWYVIPADWKWFARIAAASVLVSTLMEIEPRSPVIDGAQEDALLEIKQRLEAEAPDGAAPDPYEAELRGAS